MLVDIVLKWIVPHLDWPGSGRSNFLWSTKSTSGAFPAASEAVGNKLQWLRYLFPTSSCCFRFGSLDVDWLSGKFCSQAMEEGVQSWLKLQKSRRHLDVCLLGWIHMDTIPCTWKIDVDLFPLLESWKTISCRFQGMFHGRREGGCLHR